MTTALMVIFIIVLFIFILLLCPLSFHIVYDEEFSLKIRYLFLTFKILPSKKETKEEEKKKSQKEKTQKKDNSVLDFAKKKGVTGIFEMLKTIVKIIKSSVLSIGKHLVISKMDINILVVGEDAADTAMKYGYICSVLYPLISMIDCNTAKCNHNENIVAGFNDTKMKILCEVKARIKPVFLIKTAVFGMIKGFKAIAK